ncbi:MAG: PepSY domain-containing protein [Candidatus Entotheonellia bacterium]
MFAAAVQQAPHWRLINMRLPQREASQMTVMIEEANSRHPYPRSTLTLDVATAAVMNWEPFASYNLERTIRFWVRPVHTGEAGGLIGQIIAALVSAGGAVLVYTGLALAWRRLWQFVRRHRRIDGRARQEKQDVARSHAS